MFDRRKPDQWKQQVRRSFDATPATYGTNGDFHWEFAKRLVDRSPLEAGQSILDVATGTAPAAIMAAEHIGSQGSVVGVDLSPGILKIAKRNVAVAGAANIHLSAADAERLPFAAATFDGIMCSSAIVWFPDIPAALREWHRVAQPGGWIAFSCFGGQARQTINCLVIRLLKPYGIAYPELNTPLNSPEKCHALVREAGFSRISIQTAEEHQFTTDPEASFAQAWPSGTRFDIELAPDDVAEIKTEYIAHFAQLVPASGAWNHDYEQFVVAYRDVRASARESN